MDLTNPKTIKNLCKNHNIWPQKNHGQNFLIDEKVLDKLLETANLKSSDTVLEIGAGFGTITKELIKRAKKVIAVEMDNNLIPILQENTRDSKNLTIINNNVLSLNLSECLTTKALLAPEALAKQDTIQNNKCQMINDKYRIVANLPYNITSRFIRNALSQSPKPKDMTLIIQREVADRICAEPRGDMSLLSVSVQFYAKPKIIDYIKPESFWPEPKVESAIIKIDNIKSQSDVDEKEFFRIAKIGFSARRKMLKNNLAAGLKLEDSEIQKILKSLKISPTARAQDLGVNDWARLTNKF